MRTACLDEAALATAMTDWENQTQSKPDYVLSCRLVTPMYGGGVRAGEVDEAMPIRASGIRGQLRFWWRLACGSFASSQDMFRRETAIWGGIGAERPTASRVAVRVDEIRGVNVEAAFVYKQNDKRPGELRTMPDKADWVEPYAVFPARGELAPDKRTTTVPPHRLARAGLSFRLSLRLHADLTPTQRQEINTALRWWASFGGVGARTRRGLGAIQIRDLTPVDVAEIEARGGKFVTRSKAQSAEDAWKQAVDRLRLFRQGVNIGRNPPSPGSTSPGRSRWPEPDMIRRHTRRHASGHAPAHPVVDVYPRAAFGLPIIFHFKDPGEPTDQTLAPVDGDRLASPLILRPYWDGQHWRPAALLIPEWASVLGLQAELDPGSRHNVWPNVATTRTHLARQIRPMAGRGDDPLSAFMAYFQEYKA